MKTKQLFTVLFTLIFAGSIFGQTPTGGPDAFGYTWKTQAAGGGPAYTWKDIKATGTQITGLGDDNQKGPFNLNWSFRYYWTNYNKVWIGSNGWVAFQNNTVLPAAPFPTIPLSSLPNNYIAPLSSDLTFTQTNSSLVPGASAWYWTNNTDTLVVQYDSVPYWVNNAAGYSGRYTFQIILSGADSSVTYYYKLTQAGSVAYAMATEGLTTGIENSTGQIGLQSLTNVFPTASTAIKFYYPNPVTYQVFDATPAWNQNVENGGFFVSQSNAVNLTTDVANAGNQPISNINVTGQLFDVSLSQVWTSNLSVPSLVAGADVVQTYPAAYNANTVGTFIYRSTTSGSVPTDINSANDIIDVEMVVVDTSLATISLAYSEATSPATQNSWGGNGGQGIYIEPPFYPAAISSLDFMVTNSGTSGYHLAQIVDDDGSGNSPGTVLYLDSAAASAASLGVYNNIPVTSTIVVTSGGVYVGWFENGDSLSAIGTDATLPLSNRNYEIIGGSWSSYRNNGVDDIMIKVNITKYNLGVLTTSTTQDGCPSNNTGSATVSVTGGNSPFTYMWSPGGQTTATITGLAAGNYSVTVTDVNGVSQVATVSVYNNVAVSATASTNVTCYGGTDGSATATIGGTTPYTYMWSPGGQTTQTATGLTAGIYTVTATNADGCFNSDTVTITSPAMIAATYSITAETCVGNNGSAAATVTGGTGSYTYVWSTTPAQTTATATGLAAGSYTLSITDANGCTSSSVATITNTPFNISTSSTAVSCFNGSDGTATTTATSGGTAPYTYAWGTTPVQVTQTATGLSAGTYSVLVTDAAGCTKTATVTLTNPTIVFTTATSTPCTTCPTTPNGTATGSATGGTGPYAYSWSTTPVQSTATATGLLPGTYTVCATDSKGCTNCVSVTVIDNTSINEIFAGASIVISPNPFNSSANVKIDFVNPVHNKLIFIVYDIYGREIQSIDLSDMKGASIDFTLNRGYNISNGLYFFRLKDSEGILSSGKIVVQ